MVYVRAAAEMALDDPLPAHAVGLSDVARPPSCARPPTIRTQRSCCIKSGFNAGGQPSRPPSRHEHAAEIPPAVPAPLGIFSVCSRTIRKQTWPGAIQRHRYTPVLYLKWALSPGRQIVRFSYTTAPRRICRVSPGMPNRKLFGMVLSKWTG